jgi:hypothetical protein
MLMVFSSEQVSIEKQGLRARQKLVARARAAARSLTTEPAHQPARQRSSHKLKLPRDAACHAPLPAADASSGLACPASSGLPCPAASGAAPATRSLKPASPLVSTGSGAHQWPKTLPAAIA